MAAGPVKTLRRNGSRPLPWGRRPRTPPNRALALLLALCCAAPARAFAQDEERSGPLGFAIPETREVRELHQRALDHATAGRWGEALAAFQELLGAHPAELIAAPPQSAPPQGARAGRTRPRAVRLGAADVARRALFALPEEARSLYAERYGGEAERALSLALGAADRRALVEVARRFPLAPAAVRASLALGDLELERGDLASARAAWERAAALARAQGTEGTEPGGSAASRLELTRDQGPAPPEASDPELRALSPRARTWQLRIDDGGEGNPFDAKVGADSSNLFPARAGDLAFVSNSMRVRAVDLWTGRERWVGPEPPGWRQVDSLQIRIASQRTGSPRPIKRSEFFEAVDRPNVLVAPATDGRVLVAALQIPFTNVGNERFQHLRITYVIPDRRLFAYDALTGAELWSHLPPPLWDGVSGSFEETARVAAPPVIAGSRVLVPAYHTQGRVDYHVACYDLRTGERLWVTGLVSGQLPLNMFGRLTREFCAAPLVVVGERAIALTQLGALAALDVVTGEILWERLYDTVPVPTTGHDWSAPAREQHWRNAPPLVEGGVIVAAPIDSPDMIGVDLASGELLWSVPRPTFLPPDQQLSGVRLRPFALRAGGVLVAGPTIAFGRGREGLRSAPRVDPSRGHSPALFAESYLDPSFLPLPALCGDQIVLASPSRRAVLDADALRAEPRAVSLAWEGSGVGGNLLIEGEFALVLSNKYLWGAFDWEARERRLAAEAARRFPELAPALDLARLLVERARAELDGADLSAAVQALARAERALENRQAAPSEKDLLARVSYEIALLSAEAFVQQADSAAALQRLERARSLAWSAETLRDALFLSAELQRARRDSEALSALLDELERCCADLEVPELRGWPRRGGDGEEAGLPRPLLGLWIQVRRVEDAAQRGDLARELELLHAILERWGEAPVSALSGAAPQVTTSERIRQRLEQGPQALAAHEPIERRAGEALERALASGDKTRALEAVIELYPHSKAAARAAWERLEAALLSGRADVAASLVQRELAPDFRLPRASERDVQALRLLSSALGARGGRALEEGLLRRLARHRPEVRSTLSADGGRTMAELSRALPAPGAAERPASTFDAGATVEMRLPGGHTLFASRPGEGEGPEARQRERLIFLRPEPAGGGASAQAASTLLALPPGTAVAQAWSASLPFSLDSSLATRCGDLALLADSVDIAAVDLRDGALAWLFGEDAALHVESLECASGVAVLVRSSEPLVVAREVSSGIVLWRGELSDQDWPFPVVGREHLALFSREARGAVRTLDLFTGRECAAWELSDAPLEADVFGAWIEGGALLVPSFPKASTPSARAAACLSAYDLEDGRRLWRVEGDERRELDAVVRTGEGTYLLFSAVPFGGRAASGSLVQVHARDGSTRAVHGALLQEGDAVIGVEHRSVVRLDEPFLFLRSSAPGGRETLVRAIHLPFGERWQARLPVPPDRIQGGAMPLPAVSATAVAIAWSELRPGHGGTTAALTRLAFLDRSSGSQQSLRDLRAELGSAEDLLLRPAGSSLVIERPSRPNWPGVCLILSKP